MESANVIILYFFTDFPQGNGVAVFNNWFEAKKDENQELFAKYLTYWVAGTKLIFIVLLLVILITGDFIVKLCGVGVMVLSIATYFWRLHPIIKKLDNNGMITPKGYSKVLGLMILGFLTMFSLAFIIQILITYVF